MRSETVYIFSDIEPNNIRRLSDIFAMDSDENYSLKIEATEVIKEIRFAVKSADLSKVLKSTDNIVYFNVQTKEDCKFCIELTLKGFRMVGRQFDTVDMAEEQSKYYETFYALLDSISPEYRNTFGDTLAKKLERLQQMESEDT